MSVAKRFAGIGGFARRVIPQSIGLKLAYPVFAVLAHGLEGDDWQLTYLGDGQFEYIGSDCDERKIGRMEALLSILPALYGLVPVFYIMAFMDGVAGSVAAPLAAVYVLCTMVIAGEVRVNAIPTGETA